MDNLALARVRERSGLSVKNFAMSAGWSTSYQYKLEAGEYKTVTAEVADIILEVLAKEGFYTKDGV
jgi:transcriptional regulator with XRE-family HTH domain